MWRQSVSNGLRCKCGQASLGALRGVVGEALFSASREVNLARLKRGPKGPLRSGGRLIFT